MIEMSVSRIVMQYVPYSVTVMAVFFLDENIRL